jgi:hypothetical protein
MTAMRELWKRHLELLKIYDELEQCKRRISLDDDEFVSEEEYHLYGSSMSRVPSFALNQRYYEALEGAVSAYTELKESTGNLKFYRFWWFSQMPCSTLNSNSFRHFWCHTP